ncbi:hypothetical protein [Rugosimonospora africana]|uniref:Uncharacterized protein n=1 Tax=Rugosimonospora africana TaxID=556532 RepID=A0A8J3QPK3_9ACTN|nr:hypothetical protein [Rugosimonospora africana]GIH14703.1 hypothetical protein Raf01_28750 [Rugosimonospora africana]
MTTNTTKAAPKTRARKPRTTATAPVVVSFSNSLLAYLDIALTGPLGPGGVAHRITRYLVTEENSHGAYVKTSVIGAACQPIIDRPVIGTDDDTETAPVTICRAVSAALAQSLGVTRCTDTACYPVQADELPGGAR